MARAIGPDDSVRAVYLRSGLVAARGVPVTYYLDEQLTQRADVLALTGEPLAESSSQVDEWSRWPLVQYPDDVLLLYGSVAGGPAIPLPARIPEQLDEIRDQIAASEMASAEAVDELAESVNVGLAGKRNVLPSVTYLDVYNSLFGGVPFVTGQRTTATTLSAAADAGATSVTVASATSIVTGMLMVVGAGTPQQQLLTVTNVAGSVLTVSPALAASLPSGATIAPVWLNVSHITADSVGGSRAYGYWLANAKRPDGSYVFDGPAGQTVVWLGDSWTAEAIIEFEAELDARLGDTTVVNAGIPGNKLSQMIARFATDVAPHNPDVVVLEYGVNDVYALLTANQMAAELQQAVTMCQAIGARVVIPGVPPLVEHPGASADRNVELKALASSPEFPSAGVTALLPRMEPLLPQRNPSSVRFGIGSQVATTGANNTAFGPGTQAALTTGASNTAVGNQVQNKIVSANYNTGVGQGAQFNATASFNTGIGALAQFSQTSGQGNVAIGYGADYSPAGVTANANLTASYRTIIGYQAGAAGTAQDDRVVAIGMWAQSSGPYAVAIGSQATTGGIGAVAIGGNTSATANGAVAIGRDNAGTGANATLTNQITLGTDKHFVHIPGTLRLPTRTDPASPTNGDIWFDGTALKVRIAGVTRTVTVS